MTEKLEPATPVAPAVEEDSDLIPTHAANLQADDGVPKPTPRAEEVAADREQSSSEAGVPKIDSDDGGPSDTTPVQGKASQPSAQTVSPAVTRPEQATTMRPPAAPQGEARKSARPKSLGLAYMQQQDRTTTPVRVYVALGSFLAVFGLVFGAQWWWASRPEAPRAVPELDPSRFGARTQRQQDILQEMANAEALAQRSQLPDAARREAFAGETSQPHPKSPKGSPKGPRGVPAAQPVPEPPDPIRQGYEAIYGPASDTREAGIKSRGHRDVAVAKTRSSESDSRGAVLQARLVTTVASSPVNAAVIAALTEPVRLGGRLLPEGTELHGEVRAGNDNARIFVDFLYARLADGSTFDLDAVATDRNGRQGITGTRPLTGRTAGSVGLSGGQAMARGVASSIPGIGGAIASGAAAMADAASNKAQRLDRDEVIVQAVAETLISVYVRSARTS